MKFYIVFGLLFLGYAHARLSFNLDQKSEKQAHEKLIAAIHKSAPKYVK